MINEHEAKLRQILIDALESAKTNNGVWLNETGKKEPRIFGKDVQITAFNSVVMAAHSDQNRGTTNDYTSFMEARQRNESVKGHESGVPFLWYNWREYVNSHNPTDIITKDQYQNLSAADKKNYKGIRSREYRTLFNIDQTLMPFVSKETYEKEQQLYGTAEKRQQSTEKLQADTEKFYDAVSDYMVEIRPNGESFGYYDPKQDAIYLPSPNLHATYPDYVQDLLRQVAAATGHGKRLSRPGVMPKVNDVPSVDSQRKERLTTELIAGVKALEMGIPAKLAPEDISLIDYWQKELREDPTIINSLEVSVNQGVDLIHKMEEGKMAKRVPQEPMLTREEKGKAKSYHISDYINTLPSSETKEFVIVRDKKHGTADVILPQGASSDMKPLVGMNKNRITNALQKEGITIVSFFNKDGALSHRPDDASYKGKEVSLSKLNNWELNTLQVLNLSRQLNQANKVNFDQITLLNGGKGNWFLFIKPNNENPFSVKLDKADTNYFFAGLNTNTEEEKNEKRLTLARNYYADAVLRPEIKLDLFSTSEKDIDLSLIEKVSLYRTKPTGDEPGKTMCKPVITGLDDVEPREISRLQWDLTWLATDKAEYKRNLAATLYADILRPLQEQNKKAETAIRRAPRPVKAVRDQISELDEKYAQAVEKGNTKKATQLFNESLRLMAVAGIMPYMSYENNYLLVRKDARSIKSMDQDVIERTADKLAPFIPKDAVLVPIPSHSGRTTDMLALAEAISDRTGAEVSDILRCKPHQSQYEAKKEEKPLTPEEIGMTATRKIPMTKIPIFIDNVIDTGATAEAAVKAVGRGIVVSLASTASTYRQAVRVDDTGAIAKKDDKLILLSERFQRLSEKVQKEKDEAEKKEAERKQAEAKKQEEEKRRNSPEQKAKEEREEKAKEELTKAETKAVAAVVLTPILKQYNDLKAKHPDALLLFRGGDFYHTYNDDARKASSILGITLTRRHEADGKTIDMAGFPYTELDTFLPKLIRAGQRVAICDQLESPRQQAQHQQSELPAAIEQSEQEPEAVEEDNRPRRSR